MDQAQLRYSAAPAAVSGLILIVEDNASTRKALRAALAAEGHEIFEAESGAAALGLAAAHLPALVLLDCRLPDLSAFEVAERLHTTLPGLPIIAMTGWAQADEAHRWTAGFVDILPKPVEPTRLLEVVREHIGSPARTADLGRPVLVIDDDPVQRRLAERALASAGFQVATAESGEVGLELARRLGPHLVVSDVLLSGMDGFHVAQAIRSDPSLATVPVVLTSTFYIEERDRALAARFGASRYVSRSGGFGAVVRAVSEAIDEPVELEPMIPAAELENEYLRRVAHQLERQAAIGADLVRRTTLEATALSVLDAVSDALARQLDPESALDETLAQCLDATGLSAGAVLLRSADKKRFAVRTQMGATAATLWAEHTELLKSAIERGGLTLPSIEAGPMGASFLAASGVASALIIPIVARDDALGLFVLASNRPDFVGTDSASFVRAARSVSRQLGQAIALSRTFSRLISAEQRYRVLLENANDAIGILSVEGVILEVNREWEKIVGVPRLQLIGRRIYEYAPEEESDVRRTDFARTVVNGRGFTPAQKIRRPDGAIVHVDVSRTLVQVGSEKLVLTVGRDVTEQLRLTEQLRQTQKMEAIGRLAGGVAHDFNNMLSVILSYEELILARLQPDDPIHDDVVEIGKAGKRAADLTRQLLMFSRQQVLEPKAMNLNGLLADMEKMLTRILGEDIALETFPTASLPRVRVDAGSIQQMVMNLVINARDAMPRGGKLSIATANVLLDDAYAHAHVGSRAGRHVMLSVSDNGTGMDKATQARIFEPFFTTKEKGKGTGLGLSTVFGIVQQSGGHVWVYSEEGLGTTFKVFLPAIEAEEEESHVSSAGSATLRGTETILLVEDEDQVRAVARGILQRHGYRVIEARSAGEALRACENYGAPIHLLVSDVVMPEMSGPELAELLASRRPDMKVLCMSGYTDDAAVRHGVVRAELAYLQKPLTVEALTKKVRDVLDAT